MALGLESLACGTDSPILCRLGFPLADAEADHQSWVSPAFLLLSPGNCRRAGYQTSGSGFVHGVGAAVWLLKRVFPEDLVRLPPPPAPGLFGPSLHIATETLPSRSLKSRPGSTLPLSRCVVCCHSSATLDRHLPLKAPFLLSVTCRLGARGPLSQAALKLRAREDSRFQRTEGFGSFSTEG